MDLEAEARSLVTRGKGILAADESLPTIEKRFKTIGVPSTEETRRNYRELLIDTPGLSEVVSGIILHDETFRQKAYDGTPFPQLIRRNGMSPGIKVDLGLQPMVHFPGERLTQGLDGLRERLDEYRQQGMRFTKWRAVVKIGDKIPTRACIESNSWILAQFAGLSQEAGMVPIVEPEVLMDGTHSIERCREVMECVLRQVFDSLLEHRVILEQMLLKTSMVLPAKECAEQAGTLEVSESTILCLRRVVPAAVPGILFLSGGQSDVMATRHLNGINKLADGPWELSFSFGRALQSAALASWKGESANVGIAWKVFQHRLRCVGAARRGRYKDEMEEKFIRPRESNRLTVPSDRKKNRF